MRSRIQLPLQTADLVTAFMIWVLLSSLLPAIRQDIAIPANMVGLVTAIPVVLGSILRVPFGYLANLLGARAVFTISFAVLLVPVWFLGQANTYEDLLVSGTFLGIAGALFSVGVTSLPKYYPKERHGFVNGVYGFGNVGTALTAWFAPLIALSFGWRAATQVFLVLLLVFVLLNIFLGDRNEPRVRTAFASQLRAIVRRGQLWVFSLYYFVTFGAFVALTVYLPTFLTSHYHMNGVDAGFAVAVFVVAAALLRVVGGWLADHLNCRRLLAAVFAGIAAGTLVLALAPDLPVFLAGVYVLAAACGIGNGVVFKLMPQYFLEQAGVANGIVSMWGGLGGFFPPLVLGASMSLFGTSAPALALLGLFAVVCFCLTGRKAT